MTEKNYGSRLTITGEREYAQAQLEKRSVSFSYLELGDGAGLERDPDPTRTNLHGKKVSVPITALSLDPSNPNWLVAEAVVPKNIGGFWVREFGIRSSTNELLVIGSYPPTYKATADGNNAVMDLLFKIAVLTTSDAQTQIVLAPSELYVTQMAMLNEFESHKADRNGHASATTALKGFARYATVTEAIKTGSTQEDAAVTPAGLQKALSALALGGETVDGMLAHILAVDPHNQYLNDERHAEIHKGQRASRYFYANF